jgi:hypothetical protein
MRIKCPHCGEITAIPDSEVKAYIGMIAGRTKSEAKAQSCRENASRPRPNAKGKPKPRKNKAATEDTTNQ